MAPPRPATSISRKAAGSGEPNRVAIAAKLPAEPTTASVRAGISRLEKCSARTASPPPRAIRGLPAEHGAQRQGGQRGKEDAGDLVRE